MPVILTTPEEIDHSLEADTVDPLSLQRPLPDAALRIVAKGEKEDEASGPREASGFAEAHMIDRPHLHMLGRLRRETPLDVLAGDAARGHGGQAPRRMQSDVRATEDSPYQPKPPSGIAVVSAI